MRYTITTKQLQQIEQLQGCEKTKKAIMKILQIQPSPRLQTNLNRIKIIDSFIKNYKKSEMISIIQERFGIARSSAYEWYNRVAK